MDADCTDEYGITSPLLGIANRLIDSRILHTCFFASVVNGTCFTCQTDQIYLAFCCGGNVPNTESTFCSVLSCVSL